MLARHIRIVIVLALSASVMTVITGLMSDTGQSQPARGDTQSTVSRGDTQRPGGLSVVARPRAGVKQLTLYATAKATQPRATTARSGPYGTERVFLVKRRAGDRTQLYLPTRPNGSTAWADNGDLRLSRIDTRVVIDRERFVLQVFKRGELIRQERVGLGEAERPTPEGRFYLTELIRPRDPSGPYGAYAFGLSGHSDVVRSFAGSDGQLGIHGTNQPELIGRAVSNGCIRLTNESIAWLVRALPLGTPVEVE